ncbi:MAG: hypothetical protein ACO4AI_04735 [Prochlorothrix sp.]|nr:hypothetical protein [Prochlorothrix sp.]
MNNIQHAAMNAGGLLRRIITAGRVPAFRPDRRQNPQQPTSPPGRQS